MKRPVIQFYTVMDGDVVKQFKCQIDRVDGFTAVGRGATVARALLDAALKFANREKQEFNRAEHEKREASKRDYSMHATRYEARRDPPLMLIDTDTVLDIQLALGQFRPVISQLMNANDDYEESIRPRLRTMLDGVDFMTPPALEVNGDTARKEKTKMKNLDELGISPTPWSVLSIYNDFIMSAVGNSVCQVQWISEDGLFIAAAPEMYKALWEILERNHHCSACPHDKDGDCKGCVGERAHDALRKASGESEVVK